MIHKSIITAKQRSVFHTMNWHGISPNNVAYIGTNNGVYTLVRTMVSRSDGNVKNAQNVST